MRLYFDRNFMPQRFVLENADLGGTAQLWGIVSTSRLSHIPVPVYPRHPRCAAIAAILSHVCAVQRFAEFCARSYLF